uniref:Uncharacterized protein n=1 Tax=Arundo donax TaxID=35708 RepID=A0A0A9F9J7_ARUDO
MNRSTKASATDLGGGMARIRRLGAWRVSGNLCTSLLVLGERRFWGLYLGTVGPLLFLIIPIIRFLRMI